MTRGGSQRPRGSSRASAASVSAVPLGAPPAPTELVVYRANAHPDAMWSIPSPAGRFNPAGTGPTQYFAEHPLGALAERIRSVERYLEQPLRGDDPLYSTLASHVWVLKLDLSEVFDLTFSTAGLVGLTADQLVQDDLAHTQQAGERYGRLDLSFPKVWRYPSSALPGTANIVVFGARRMVPYDLRPTSRLQMPGSLAAARAAAPVELAGVMRHFGEPHAGLDAWVSGNVYVLPQPLSFVV
ncbi:MAG: RES family NAD+ phosphorylase [Candidatus Dormibacteria bacterium]